MDSPGLLRKSLVSTNEFRNRGAGQGLQTKLNASTCRAAIGQNYKPGKRVVPRPLPPTTFQLDGEHNEREAPGPESPKSDPIGADLKAAAVSNCKPVNVPRALSNPYPIIQKWINRASTVD